MSANIFMMHDQQLHDPPGIELEKSHVLDRVHSHDDVFSGQYHMHSMFTRLKCGRLGS